MKLTSKVIKKAIQKYIKTSNELKELIYKEVQEGRFVGTYEPYRDPICASRGYCILNGGCKCGMVRNGSRLAFESLEAYLEKYKEDGRTVGSITRTKRYNEDGYIVREYRIGLLSGTLALYEKDDTLFARWIRYAPFKVDVEPTVISKHDLEWDVKADMGISLKKTETDPEPKKEKKNELRGIKNWQGIVDAGNKDKAIERTCETYKQFPTIWGGGWPTVHWAFVNTMHDNDIAPVGFRNGGFTTNLHEVLTEEDIQHIKETLEIEEEYTPSWEH